MFMMCVDHTCSGVCGSAHWGGGLPLTQHVYLLPAAILCCVAIKLGNPLHFHDQHRSVICVVQLLVSAPF